MGRPAPSAVVLTGGYMRDGEGEGVVGIAVARPTGGQGRGWPGQRWPVAVRAQEQRRSGGR